MSDHKRKHITLTINEKVEILRKIEQGESQISLARFYGLGRATIYDILKKKDKIENFQSCQVTPSQRKTIKSGECPFLEEVLYRWFLQERMRQGHISGYILKQKARYFYSKLMGNDYFKASGGWLDRFKQRFGIKLSSMRKSEKINCSQSTYDTFLEKVEGLEPDQVYNAGESGLLWRFLPNKTVGQLEETAFVKKISKDRITFMPCANASGTHKLDLLVVGKTKNPRVIKHIKSNLPVYYRNKKKSWITRDVILEWFHDNFVPSVKYFLNKQKLPQKAILILNHAPGHLNEMDFKTENDFVDVIFLPPNCTHWLTPMEQNVIQLIKKNYKKSLLCSVIGRDGGIVKLLEEIDLKDAVFNLASAWRQVTTSTIVSSWQTLWPSNALLALHRQENTEQFKDSTLSELGEAVLNSCRGDTVFNKIEIDNWIFGADEENFQFLSDDEIIDEAMDDDLDVITDTEVPYSSDTSTNKVKHAYAAAALNTAIKWAEENEQSSDTLMNLKLLREQAVMKSIKPK